MLWSHAAQGAAGQPYADNELAVFTAYTPPSFEEGRVIALDTRSGAVRWEHQLPPPPGLHLGGPPSTNIVAYEDLVIAPVWGVTALDRRTGAVRWRFQPPPDDLFLIGVAAVDEGRLFMPGRETFLYALDPRTGTLLWRADLGEQPVRPVTFGGVVYVATRSEPRFVSGRLVTTGHAAAVNAATGNVIWKVPFPEGPWSAGGQGGSMGPFAVTNNLVLAAGADGRVYALDRHTGIVRWTSVGSGPYFGGLAVLGQTAITAGGSVDGFDLSTGALRWQATPPGLGASVTSGDDVALVAAGTLTAYDASGNVRWRHGGASSGGPTYTTPATHHGGVVYANSTTGLQAIRPPGKEEGSMRAITNSPTASAALAVNRREARWTLPRQAPIPISSAKATLSASTYPVREAATTDLRVKAARTTPAALAARRRRPRKLPVLQLSCSRNIPSGPTTRCESGLRSRQTPGVPRTSSVRAS